jgi:hypothetical protein
MMGNITSAVVRYHNDMVFKAKVDEVIEIMEIDKPTNLTDEELSIISIAASLAIEIAERK